MFHIFRAWKQDLPSSLIVFFVALPLCLGIGLASTSVEGIGPLPLAGLLSGIVGGIVVGFVSNSRLGVSGPAAGLITVVIASISTLGSFSAFLLALVLAGVLQMLFALLRAGIIANYLPSGVIKGMLAAIGITLILKEIPHLIGYDKDYMGDDAFFQLDGHNTFSELLYAAKAIDYRIAIIGVLSLVLVFVFDRPWMKKMRLFKVLPALLLIILIVTTLNYGLTQMSANWQIASENLVQIPKITSWNQLVTNLHFPDFTQLSNPKIYGVALTIAIVASLETLLCVEAIDRLDPEKTTTNTNRELFAQGLGNCVTGLLGGIPITQVIVRSTANLNSGGKTKMSAVYHGFLLILAVFVLAPVLNFIPLAILAAILISVGYKLTNLKIIKQQFQKGWEQFIPFVVTIVAILFTDLLIGIGIGLLVAIFYIIRRNFKGNHEVTITPDGTEIRFGESVNFLNIASIKSTLEQIKSGSNVVVNTTNCKSMDLDVKELLLDFVETDAVTKNINVQVLGNHLN
jgi:carbonic anhydrase